MIIKNLLKLRALIQEMCKLQLVPADKLRHNVVEQAISTFKNHFLVILIGVDPSFPIHLWDRLILQSVLA